ncbi:MAG: S9 family peptidase [Rickettsiaceae bacterium]|nr:S9 family peptidase [Rickettsiaceae bacterium]
MTNAQLIPKKILFGDPEKITVRLSSDGKYISYLAPYKGALNIWVAPVENISKATPLTEDKRGLRSYVWAKDNKHIIYGRDGEGDENWRLYSLNIHTQESKLLTPEKGVRAGVVALSNLYPDEILVKHNQRNAEYFDIYKINLVNGESKLFFDNQDKYYDFVIDPDSLKIIAAIKFMPDGRSEYYHFIDNDVPQLLQTIPADEMVTSGWIGVKQGGDVVYMLDGSGQNDLPVLVEFDLRTQEKKTIFIPNQGEISGYITDPKTREIKAVSVNYMKEKWHVIDDSLHDDINIVENLEEGELSIVSQTYSGDKWLISFAKSDSPRRYYLYDRASKSAKFLFSSDSKLENLDLVKMHPVIITARDGLQLASYLTLPKKINYVPGKKVETSVPLILLVHGGPNARDYWGFSPMVQWLANRGYAVLQVNYRGSTGFGKKFVNAGDGEWAAKMQHDLEDGVEWAIKQGITTQDKVGIMGGSYGGYATLVGMTMTPGKYALGVDIVGISNLETFINTIPPYWKPARAHMNKMLGTDVYNDSAKEFLRQKSPINYVTNIKNPLMIIQGANDPRVNRDESEQMVKIMQENNIPVFYLLYPDEGHGIARYVNKMTMYSYIESFIAKFLGGEVEKEEKIEGSTVIVQEILGDRHK